MNTDTVAQMARISLKAIESLTYTTALNQKLNQILSDLRQALPAEQGMVIRPLITKQVKKKEKTKAAKMDDDFYHYHFTKKRGRARVDSKYE